METTKRKRTREEVRAAVRETIRRKKEWIEKTNKEFEMIRNGELKLKYSWTSRKTFLAMNTLRLEEINLHSSYMVGQTEGNKYSFYFDTDFGLRYTISFMLEHSFVQSGAYQFCSQCQTLCTLLCPRRRRRSLRCRRAGSRRCRDFFPGRLSMA